MKPVIQEEVTGCAIASAAAITGMTYKQAKKVANGLGIYAKDPDLWSDTKPVRSLLRHFGIKTGQSETPFENWQTLPDCALLATKWHLERGQSFWHWVVFKREGGREYVLDSKKALKNNPESVTSGRMQSARY